jgi:hypothetical protein
MFPETRGKSLKEIDQLWADNIPAWRSASWIHGFLSSAPSKEVAGGRAPTYDKEAAAHFEGNSDIEAQI